jgi:hypothetical protein
MTAKQQLVQVLLRLYPPTWRREYGPELEAMLSERARVAQPKLPQAWIYAYIGAAIRRASCVFEKRRSTAVS